MIAGLDLGVTARRDKRLFARDRADHDALGKIGDRLPDRPVRQHAVGDNLDLDHLCLVGLDERDVFGRLRLGELADLLGDDDPRVDRHVDADGLEEIDV